MIAQLTIGAGALETCGWFTHDAPLTPQPARTGRAPLRRAADLPDPWVLLPRTTPHEPKPDGGTASRTVTQKDLSPLLAVKGRWADEQP